MLSAERYLMLFSRLSVNHAVGTAIETSLEELSRLLFCTTRNAKLVLRKLEEEGLISWLPGRGRGNRSHITFKADPESFLLNLARSRAELGDYKQSFELLSEFGQDTSAKEQFIDWLNGRFGYKRETLRGMANCDTMRFPVYRRVMTLDPAEVNYAFDAHLVRQLFDRLVTHDDELGRIVPGIAHTWCSNPEGTEWTFYLRKGAQFHDGSELTAADVVFTFERLRQGKANSWLLRGLDEVKALSSRIVIFRLHQPNNIFDRYMCSCASSLLPQNLRGQEESTFWKLPIGSGAFRLVSLSIHRIELAAHAAYYAGRPYLDGVDIIILPEYCSPSSIGLPSVLQVFDTDRITMEVAPESNWQALIKLCQGCTLLSWNLRKSGPQQSLAFRHAVRMILDPERMLADLGGERAYPAYGLRPEKSLQIVATKYSSEDIREALLASAYDGTPLRIVVHEKYKTDANWISARLAEWNIRTEVYAEGWEEMADPSTLMSGHLTVSGIMLAEDEVCEIDMYEHGQCTISQYLNEEWKTWIRSQIDLALGASTAELRKQFLMNIENRLREEVAVIYLHHRRLSTYMHPSVRGAGINSMGWIDFKQIWLENAN